MRIVLLLLAITFVVIGLLPRRYRLALWVLVIAGCTVPWFNMAWHAHWTRVAWIPLVSPPVRLRDIAVNLALYFPLGFFFSRDSDWKRALGGSLVLGVVLSLSAETSQVFSHGRFPSMTDVAMNGAGALGGAVVGWMLWGRR